MTNEQLQAWIREQFKNVRDDILERNRSHNAEVEWERAPVDYDNDLTEPKMVGDRVPYSGEVKPKRTLD